VPARRGGTAVTKLAQWRLKRGLTQAKLAANVGLARSTYWRLEAGKVRNPRLRELMNCAIALDCHLDDLIEDGWREWFVFDASRAAEPPTQRKRAS
jgi:transcriptional regulator with XRE-family HTH domain